jgi:uncharacterized metal-binding protein
MFERFGRSWELTKQCWALLRSNKVLVLFPILSGLASLVIIASFTVPLFLSGDVQQLQSRGGQAAPQTYLILFLFYFCLYLVQIFFSCALMGAANVAFAGGQASLGVGLSLAWSRMGRIMVWAAVAATVGMVLRTIQERVGLVGKIVVALMGAAWTILTYFMAPIIMFEDLGVTDGFQRSTAIIKKTWGEGMGKVLAFSAMTFVAVIVLMVGTFVLFAINPIVAVLFFLLGIVAVATVASAMDGIFKVALYRYACWNTVPEGFSPELMQGAFSGKK